MTNLKSIAATLALLGSGAFAITGCDKKDTGATETPGGKEAAPAEKAEGSCGAEKAEGSCGAEKEKAEGSCGAEKAEGEEKAEGSCGAAEEE